MSIQGYLQERKCEFECVPHQPTFTAQHLAHELHVPGQEVAKTVLLRCNKGCRLIVAVLPSSKAIDLVEVSKLLGGRHVQLATEMEIAEHCPDCEFGVLPPFGSRYGMGTIVDASLAEDEEIIFAASTHRDAIRMKFKEFLRVEDPKVGRFAFSD